MRGTSIHPSGYDNSHFSPDLWTEFYLETLYKKLFLFNSISFPLSSAGGMGEKPLFWKYWWYRVTQPIGGTSTLLNVKTNEQKWKNCWQSVFSESAENKNYILEWLFSGSYSFRMNGEDQFPLCLLPRSLVHADPHSSPVALSNWHKVRTADTHKWIPPDNINLLLEFNFWIVLKCSQIPLSFHLE